MNERAFSLASAAACVDLLSFGFFVVVNAIWICISFCRERSRGNKPAELHACIHSCIHSLSQPYKNTSCIFCQRSLGGEFPIALLCTDHCFDLEKKIVLEMESVILRYIYATIITITETNANTVQVHGREKRH